MTYAPRCVFRDEASSDGANCRAKQRHKTIHGNSRSSFVCIPRVAEYTTTDLKKSVSSCFHSDFEGVIYCQRSRTSKSR